MMRHNGQKSKPKNDRGKYRRSNKDTSVPSEGKDRRILCKSVPCLNGDEQNSGHDLMQVVDSKPSGDQPSSSHTLEPSPDSMKLAHETPSVNADTVHTLGLSTDSMELTQETPSGNADPVLTLCLSPDTMELTQETPSKNAGPVELDDIDSGTLEQPDHDDGFELPPVGEDNSDISQVTPLSRDETSYDDVQPITPEPSIIPTSYQFKYNLPCCDALVSKHWVVESSQDLGFNHHLIIRQIVMSPGKTLLPFAQLEAGAWCTALKHWEPWLSTVACVKPTDEGARGSTHETCTGVKGITFMNVHPEKFSLKLSLNDETAYPFDPGIWLNRTLWCPG